MPENTEDRPAAPEAAIAPRGGGKRNTVVVVVVIAAVALMLWVGVRQARQGYSALPGGAGTMVELGKTAPDFELSTLDGKSVHLSDFRGKAVVLNFWATWCEPCKIEMPWLVDLQKQYGPQGLQVVGVAMDDAGKDAIQKFAQKMGVNYVVLQGKNAVGDAYGAQWYPTTVYIDRSGTVLNRVVGLVGRGDIENNIKQALGSQGQPAPAAATASPSAQEQPR